MHETSYQNREECQFQTKYGGRCGKSGENGWCIVHKDLRCIVCGKKATKECDFTDVSLDHPPGESDHHECRDPLCDNHEHEPYVPGVIMFPRHHVHMSTEEAEALRSNPYFPAEEWHENGWTKNDWRNIDP